jgi:hypothetical protein
MAIIIDGIKSEEKSLYDILIAQAKGRSPKKKPEDDDDLGDEEAPPKKSGKSSKEEDDDDDDDIEDDNWNKDEAEDDAWDPDFEEFDLPKSKGKKAVGGAKKGAEEEEDFKVDDEFKDLFNDGGSLDEDEEDDF